MTAAICSLEKRELPKEHTHHVMIFTLEAQELMLSCCFGRLVGVFLVFGEVVVCFFLLKLLILI